MTAEDFKKQLMPYSRKLYPMMRRFLGGEEETKDALQDLMLKLWNKRDHLEQCANPEGYIATMAKNFCIDLKKKPRVLTMDLSLQEKLQPTTSCYDPDAGETLEHVHRIMLDLPDNYREVLQYREIDGFSYEEIEALSGYGMPYIRVLLSRARIKLKKELEKIYSYEKGTVQSV